jgi:DNA-binding IclR family transcriptional regulator
MALDKDLDKYRAPALDKGLDILELLAATEEGLSQVEIAKALDRSPNEIYRMLDRLVRRDYVRRTSTDRYELTLKLFELSHVSPPMRRLISQSTPTLRRFAREAEQSVHLVMHERDVLIVVAQVDGPDYWNLSVRVGSRIGIVNTGSGHIFLAFASDEERALMLDAPSGMPREKLSAELRKRLASVREQRFEIMPSQQVAGVTNLSVPVFGPLGSVVAVLTCPYTQRLDTRSSPGQDLALRLLVSASEEISQRSIARD